MWRCLLWGRYIVSEYQTRYLNLPNDISVLFKYYCLVDEQVCSHHPCHAGNMNTRKPSNVLSLFNDAGWSCQSLPIEHHIFTMVGHTPANWPLDLASFQAGHSIFNPCSFHLTSDLTCRELWPSLDFHKLTNLLPWWEPWEVNFQDHLTFPCKISPKTRFVDTESKNKSMVHLHDFNSGIGIAVVEILFPVPHISWRWVTPLIPYT